MHDCLRLPLTADFFKRLSSPESGKQFPIGKPLFRRIGLLAETIVSKKSLLRLTQQGLKGTRRKFQGYRS